MFDEAVTEQLVDLDPNSVDLARVAVLGLADASHRGPSEIVVVQASASHRLAKRVLDVCLSFVMLVGTAPLSIGVAFAIWLQDRGPVIYRQRRWGYLGREFTLLKFRTMRPESERMFGVTPADEDDHRVTPVGVYLRRSGLDELPQLINILKGDMSFVGPRALAIAEMVEEEGRPINYRTVPGFWQRLAVRPGLTGVATIYLRKDAPPSQKFEQDVAYVAEQSLWLDMKLIALSFWISIRGKWESRTTKL